MPQQFPKFTIKSSFFSGLALLILACSITCPAVLFADSSEVSAAALPSVAPASNLIAASDPSAALNSSNVANSLVPSDPYLGSFKLESYGGGTVSQSGLTTTISGSNFWGVGDLSTKTNENIIMNVLSAFLQSNTGRPTIGDGAYNCSGNLTMINTAGFIFSQSASVEAANVLISTLNVDREKFMDPANKQYEFFKDGANAFIINAGRIAAKPGGYIALLSQAIDNKGGVTADGKITGTITVESIEAKIGQIVLASGNKMTVALDDAGLISVGIDEAVKDHVFGPDGEAPMDSAIKNSGTILAAGGKVTLTAKTIDHVFAHTINNSGVIEAKTWAKHNGIIELLAEGAPVLNTGTMKADEIRATVKKADFLNEGDILAPKIQISAPDGQIINKEKIAANGSLENPNGGKITITADRILQQGIISANASDGGTGGDIVIESQTNTTLDTGSRTEARGDAVVGNGGTIRINSKGGRSVVNEGAVIDVSSGELAGNGGFVEISAFQQLGFYGLLNGRAPPGYTPGKVLFDPWDFYTSWIAGGTINATSYAVAQNDIIIDSNLTINGSYTLYLLANYNDDGSWHSDGLGTIRRTGDYTISGSLAYLELWAGSGIGSASLPIKTNVAFLKAVTNTGSVYISQGTTNVRISGMVAAASNGNGDVTFTALGSILDDSTTYEYTNLDYGMTIDFNGDGTNDLVVPSCIYGNSVTISAPNGNIGGMGSESDPSTYSIPMLDVLLGSGTLTATAGGNIYIMAAGKVIGGTTYYADVSSSRYSLNSTGVNKELGLANYWGSLTIDQAISGDDSRGFGANTNIIINSSIATSGSYLKFFAGDNILIAASLSSSNATATIKMVADYGAFDSVGAITQTGGTIGSGTENLILSAATGINLTSMHVAKLQATNTTSGDISVTNTGTLILTNLDGSRISSGGVYYSVWNKENGNVSITTVGSTADIILRGIDTDVGTGVVLTDGNITLISGRDIKSDNLYTGAVWTGDGDVLLQAAGGDILDYYWIVSGKLTSGQIALAAGKNLGVGAVYFVDANEDPAQIGTIKLTSGGSVIQAEDSDPIIADKLIVSAATGITLPNAQIANLQAVNTTSGNISVTNTGMLTLTNLDGGKDTAGDYYAIWNKGAGSISITATGSSADIILQGISTSLGTMVEGDGDISLIAGRDVKSGATNYGDIYCRAGDVLLQAGRDIAFYYWIESAKATNGKITLTAVGNVGLGTVTFLDASDNPTQAGTIKLTAGGSVTQVTGGNGLVTDQLIVSAGTGITLPNTKVAKLQAVNTTSGNINVINTGSLILTSLDHSLLPSSDPYEGDDLYSIWNNGTGSVSITANGATADIIGIGTSTEDVCAIRAKGNVNVTAGRDIILGDSVNNKYADIYTDAGDVTLNAGRDFKMQGNACWLGSSKDNGTISITAARDAYLATVGFYLIDLTKDTGTVTATAGGSIFDDSKTVEQSDQADNGTKIPTLIKAKNITLSAGGDIGGFSYDEATNTVNIAPMLDIALGSGLLKATAGGNIYIAEYVASTFYTSHIDTLDSTGTDKEIGLANFAPNGDFNINSPLSVNDTIWLAAVRDIIVNNTFATSGDSVALNAMRNIAINSGAAIAGHYEIDLSADISGTGTGSINQTGGTVGSGAEQLILSAATGINLTDTRVSSLQAVNTTSGNISVTNTGTFTLTNLDGSKEAAGEYYAVWNKGTGNVSITALGSTADIILQGVDTNLGTLVEANGDISLIAGRDVKSGATNYGDIYSDAGDVLLQAGRDIAFYYWIESAKVTNGKITLTAAGNVGLGTVTFLDASDNPTQAGTIKLTAGGSVTQVTGGNGLVTDQLIVSAGTGITLPNTKVAKLQATNTASGNISITNSGNLTITDMTNANTNDRIDLTVNGDLTFAGGTFTKSKGSIAVSGNILIASGTFNSDSTTAFSVGSGKSFSITDGAIFNRFTGAGTSGDPYVIYDVYGLQAMKCYLSASFKLNANIDASKTSSWNAGGGFIPVGTSAASFTGSFDGNSHTISGLYINNPVLNSNPDLNDIGLFGYAWAGASITNVGLLNVNIACKNSTTGSLVGTNRGIISNSYATGTVNGGYEVGGLVGKNRGSISNSYSTCTVSGVNSGLGGNYAQQYIGGLVGWNYSTGSISNSYSTGNVSAGDNSNSVGGLVGYNSGSVSSSYSTGGVMVGNNNPLNGVSAGGFVGNNEGSISNAYSTGNVSAGTSASSIGGFAGYNVGAITDSYSIGNVSVGTTGYAIGGFIGNHDTAGSLTNSYATGAVSVGSGSSQTGGLVGKKSGTITNSYFTDGSHNNGYGTYESSGVSAFYAPSHAVYNIGGASQWDIFTPIWDVYTDKLPRLHFENQTGNIASIWSGTTSSNWSTASNWVGGVVPGASASIFISARTYNPVAGSNISLSRLLIGSGAVLDSGTFTISGTNIDVYGTLLVNATTFAGSYAFSGSTSLHTDSTVSYSRLGNQTINKNLSYGNLTTSGSGTKTPDGDISVGGNLTIGASTTFAPAGHAVVVSGSYVNNGTLAMTVSDITAANKIYDGGIAASLNTASAALVGSITVGTKAITLNAGSTTGTFDTKNVGNSKTVTVTGLTLALSGGNVGSYALTSSTTANITPRTLTVTATGVNKVYDGSTTGTVTLSDNRVLGDVFTDSYSTATFNNKNVGDGKAVSVTGISISGTDAGNYTFNTTASTTASIAPKNLIVNDITVGDKVYDGNTTAVLSTGGAALVGIISGEIVTLNTGGALGAFDTKNVGNAKVVTVSGLTIGGADMGNYTLTQPTITANVTPQNLTVSGITASDKVYDGNTTATLSTGAATLVGIISGETVTLNVGGALGAFDTKNVGNAKVVTVSGLTIGGADVGNYLLTQPTTTADVTPKTLSVSSVTADKVYDGTNVATLNISGAAFVGMVGGDNLVLNLGSATGAFDNKNIGVGKTVTGLISDLALSGTDAGNYSLTQPTITTANISPKALTVSGITASSKVYDGTDAATIDVTGALLVGVVGTEIVTLDVSNAKGVFADIDVGTGKTVTVSGLTIGGADAGNYMLPDPTVTADITAILPLPGEGVTEEATTQLSVFTAPRVPSPTLAELLTYQVNTYGFFTGPVYFYNAPTPYDLSAFDFITFSEGNLQFLNGEIILIGHEGLLPS